MTDFELEFGEDDPMNDPNFCLTCDGKGELTEDDDWDTVECPDCEGLGF